MTSQLKPHTRMLAETLKSFHLDTEYTRPRYPHAFTLPMSGTCKYKSVFSLLDLSGVRITTCYLPTTMRSSSLPLSAACSTSYSLHLDDPSRRPSPQTSF